MITARLYKIIFMILIFMLTLANATVGQACGVELPELEEITITAEAL